VGDPGNWSTWIWLLIALMLAAICGMILFGLWALIFRKRGGRLLDAFLVGIAGLIFTGSLLTFQFFYAEKLSPGRRQIAGYLLMAVVGIPLVWLSNKLVKNRRYPR